MKGYYFITRVVICVLAGVISLIVLRNEHITFQIGATVIIAIVALVVSFFATPMSKKMVSIGDSIICKSLRVFYYIILLPLILLVVYLFWILIQFFYDHMEHAAELGKALGDALLTVFLCAVTFIVFIIPYIQALLVLLVRRILRDNNTSN
ncbi:MAG: hypothetical protein E7286_02535 [Lachnospiraceae bacterium]|nr:hypothetical protein [Lachnospiraceae bacterium]